MKGNKLSGINPKFGQTSSALLILVLTGIAANAQSASTPTQPNQPNSTPVSADARTEPVAQPSPAPAPEVNESQKRIQRARALAAAHQLGAAAKELETVRATAHDSALRAGTSVMLMGIYLEEGNYARAQSLLEESFQARASARDHSLANYFALAGQAIIGVRQHLARYRSFGVGLDSTTLAPEAVNDLDRLRVLLERMVAQAKEIIKENPKANDGLALLEDVLGVRASIARDNSDRERWQTEYAQAREQLGFARVQLAASGELPSAQPKPEPTPPQANTVHNAPVTPATAQPQTIYSGLLNDRATKRVVPTYPQLAKANGTAGVVKVQVIVTESGDVQVVRSDGPTLLKHAAEVAAWGWRFSPPLSEGKPVKLSGYIEFRFIP